MSMSCSKALFSAGGWTMPGRASSLSWCSRGWNSATTRCFFTTETMPMTVYMIRNFLLSVPDAILEAARIDGCSRFRSLFSIVLPLSVPAIITSGLVNLVWAWNELMVALVFLQKENLRTLIVGTTIFKSRYSLNVPVIMAGLVVVTLPMIIVYIFGQKKLVQGLMSGAVKE